MPIDRPDGRHWCAPEQEQPDEQGEWTCPGCGQTWLHSTTDHGVLWERPEDYALRLEQEAAEAATPTDPAEAADGPVSAPQGSEEADGGR